MGRLRSVDVCSGAGGLALGLERAGFDPVVLLDNKSVACETLQRNRPAWNVLEMDLLDFDPVEHPESYDVDLLSAGLPRVKSSATAQRVETGIERRLLGATVLLAHAVQPRALLIENVPGLVDGPEFDEVRDYIQKELEHLGYGFHWFIVNAADFGVPQDREQGVLVALKNRFFSAFRPPKPTVARHITAGEALHASMSERGWTGAVAWAAQADRVAPTLVGGSDKRGVQTSGRPAPRRRGLAWVSMAGP